MSVHPWYLCPNRPRCPHGAVLHDVEDYDTEYPGYVCAVEGCDCSEKLKDR